MHVNYDALRLTAVILVVVLLFGSRMSKGSPRETADGIAFPMKPLVAFARVTSMILYLIFLGFIAFNRGQHVPPWFFLVFVVAIGFGLLQYPGTIVLGAQEISQTFWFLKPKRIGYTEVMTIQRMQAGGAVRVLGDNRVVITHTNNHSASLIFQQEIARRTGKVVQ
jgi:hypothetical protein